MLELQKERDGLAKEKTALLQKLAAVTHVRHIGVACMCVCVCVSVCM